MEKITIVNENDEVIGSKERGFVTNEDIYRVSALWIKNSSGDILLARRAHTKKRDPGKWGPAVAGTVEENESYEDNIIKESEEELGISNFSFEIGEKLRRTTPHNYFAQWFFATMDEEISYFKIDKNEVEEIRWFTLEEFEELINRNPSEIIPSLKESLKFLKIY